MTDVVIFADTVRSPELRHEVPQLVPDPFLYVERSGDRHIVVSSMEIPCSRAWTASSCIRWRSSGSTSCARAASRLEILDEIAVRAVRALGVERAIVPASFPVLLADRLRAAGVELTPDRANFDRAARQVGAELDGHSPRPGRRGAAMGAPRELFRDARQNGDGLELDGEPLTSERVKVAIRRVFLEHGASCDDFIVSHGPQSAIGHTWRGRASRRRADRDRHLAARRRVGLLGGHDADVRRGRRPGRGRRVAPALQRALDARVADTARVSRPVGLRRRVRDLRERRPPTRARRPEGEPLADGFFHSLGHGVGLEVHEQPLLGMSGHEELVAGDVLAIEPGLYRAGYGGLRLEDLVLVTEDGAENPTQLPVRPRPVASTPTRAA